VLTQANDVVYQAFEMDGPVEDIMWCGSNDESILVLTEPGTVYRSRDRGSSWKQMADVFEVRGI
jgi:hypothetical protein